SREHEARQRDRSIDPRVRCARVARDRHEGGGEGARYERSEEISRHALAGASALRSRIERRTASAMPIAIMASPQYCANVRPPWRVSSMRRKSVRKRNAPYEIVPTIV